MHNNNLFHELYNFFGRSPADTVKAYNEAMGTKYSPNIIHMWNTGSASFPINGHEWARSVVIPNLAAELNLNPETVATIARRLS